MESIPVLENVDYIRAKIEPETDSNKCMYVADKYMGIVKARASYNKDIND